jgi:hypothetical protein
MESAVFSSMQIAWQSEHKESLIEAVKAAAASNVHRGADVRELTASVQDLTPWRNTYPPTNALKHHGNISGHLTPRAMLIRRDLFSPRRFRCRAIRRFPLGFNIRRGFFPGPAFLHNLFAHGRGFFG